jgi:hypothetical protein
MHDFGQLFGSIRTCMKIDNDIGLFGVPFLHMRNDTGRTFPQAYGKLLSAIASERIFGDGAKR